MFKGSMVALVTPMLEDGSLDKKALHALVEWHLHSQTDALVIAGTTGESATLNADEQAELISLVVKQVAGRIPVIAGTGSNSTRTTIELSIKAIQAGADACLIVTPYYNRPTQAGLYEHYKTIAEKISHPIILYNIPCRTACDLLPETVEKLARLSNIIGIKEGTGDVERAKEIRQRCGDSFEVYSGDDATALDLMKAGAQGVISVTANIAPLEMHNMCAAALAGDTNLADEINSPLMLLHKRLFLETNPIPTKWALYTMGKITQGIRLPLLPLDSKYHLQVKEAMQNASVQVTT